MTAVCQFEPFREATRWAHRVVDLPSDVGARPPSLYQRLGAGLGGTLVSPPPAPASTNSDTLSDMNGLIVIGYDGSEEAGHAIDVATTIVGPTEAVVVNVWTPALVTTSAAPLSPVAPALPEEAEEEETCLEEAAWRIAGEGARRASDAGLPARTDTRCGAMADVGRLLAALADEYDADFVVVGRRGVSRLHSAVLGSVSNDTVRESRRPVLVVPCPTE